MNEQGMSPTWFTKRPTDCFRQAGILLREVTAFRAEGTEAEQRWPCILAGGKSTISLGLRMKPQISSH